MQLWIAKIKKKNPPRALNFVLWSWRTHTLTQRYFYTVGRAGDFSVKWEVCKQSEADFWQLASVVAWGGKEEVEAVRMTQAACDRWWWAEARRRGVIRAEQCWDTHLLALKPRKAMNLVLPSTTPTPSPAPFGKGWNNPKQMLLGLRLGSLQTQSSSCKRKMDLQRRVHLKVSVEGC